MDNNINIDLGKIFQTTRKAKGYTRRICGRKAWAWFQIYI